MRLKSEAISWEIRKVELSQEKLPNWLTQLSAMRGEVLYEDGRRPSFKLENGSFYDLSDMDLVGYHILAKASDEIVGCLRVVPVFGTSNSVTEEIIGKENFNSVLSSLYEKGKNAIVEASRWVVHPKFKTTKVGMNLFAGFWALILKLKCNAIASSGTYTKFFVNRGGAVPIWGIDQPFFSKLYQDFIQLVHFDIAQPPEHLLDLIDEMCFKLGLDSTDYHHKPLENEHGRNLVSLDNYVY